MGKAIVYVQIWKRRYRLDITYLCTYGKYLSFPGLDFPIHMIPDQ